MPKFALVVIRFESLLETSMALHLTISTICRRVLCGYGGPGNFKAFLRPALWSEDVEFTPTQSLKKTSFMDVLKSSRLMHSSEPSTIPEWRSVDEI